MKWLAHKWLSHPAGKLLAVAAASTAALLAPASARADTEFPEFGGVPEGLGLNAMVLDMDWTWSGLGLIVVVAALIAVDRVKIGKRKD
jgi:hypothetical protein